MPDTPQPAPKNPAGVPGSVVEFPGTPEGGRPPRNNLPLRLTGLVGRGRETSEIGRLLADNRLLTLTGAGGAGKTRLALAVASEVVGDYGDGVWLVELAPLSEPELVPQAVASVLGVREEPGRPLLETLAVSLSSRTTLLVLDNCEHLVGACASLAEALLGRCPGLSVLATSREALGVGGETLFVVPPLSLPDPRRPLDAGGLPGYEAARLFLERARAVRPGFEITEENAPAVAQVCHRLDGMPLAIELAAARARVLSVEQISSRLDDAFRLLTGGGRTALAHHATLRATMDWSYDLLSAEEKVLFGRLSVFAGGFALEAAEAVCAGDGLEGGAVLDLLAALVDKSLVLVAERDGKGRYGLLQTVRQYAAERLEGSGEAERLRGRHALFYLALAEEAEPELRGPRQEEWLGRLDAEHDNLRAALRWALEAREAELGLRLGGALGMFWYVRGHLIEGLGWLERALADGGDAPADARAKALNQAGWMAIFRGDPRASALLEESLALYGQLGDESGVATSLADLGVATVHHRGDRARLAALRREAEALRQEPPDRHALTHLLHFSALDALVEGDRERAAALAEEGLALNRPSGDVRHVGIFLILLGMVALARGDSGRAGSAFSEGLRLAQEQGNTSSGAYCLLGLAGTAALEGRARRAARLWGALEAVQGATGMALTVSPLVRSWYDYEGRVGAACERIGEEAFGAAWAQGRAMTAERAVEYALESPEAPEGTTAPPASYPADLSAREVEVLRLVARGMTNARIAEELYISPRTVNAHLRSAYHKIGSSTRAEATRFAAENDLL